MMGFLNPQDDKLESTREKFEKQKKKNYAILLMIICFVFDSYKTYRYWENKTFRWLGNVWNHNSN